MSDKRKNQGRRPLDGIKILDFSQVLAAPFCGMLLADMGAEVIKVERPGNGDISREYGPYVNDISLYFCQYNRGKKGIAVDMRSEEGKAVIMKLVSQVDIVIENFKSGTLEKLGLGYDEMKKVNPNLIYGSIAGFGTYGPLSHLPCMDIIAAARSGLVAQSGEDGMAPIKPGFSLCDTWAGLQLLRGLSMALLHRQSTGEGLRVDIAMLDSAFYMCETPLLVKSISGDFLQRSGNMDFFYSPYGEFKAKDGNVVICVKNNEQWQQLCEALGIIHLLDDPKYANNDLRLENTESLLSEIETVTVSMNKYQLEHLLNKAGVPVTAVQSLEEFMSNPQTEKLNVITKVHQDGVGKYTVVNSPIHFSKTPVNPNASAPKYPGDHSREVLQAMNFSEEEIEAAFNSGAVC